MGTQSGEEILFLFILVWFGLGFRVGLRRKRGRQLQLRPLELSMEIFLSAIR